MATPPLITSPDAPLQSAIGVVPSRNSTEPVGVPPPGATGVTVAGYITASPMFDGFSEEDTTVVVDAWDTSTVVVVDEGP